MGAEPWDYFVPYEEDIAAALDKLRRREFAAGRYYPSAQKPATMEEAIELADATGTKSILDMARVAEQPDYSAVAPLPASEQVRLFGTDKPTRRMIEENLADMAEEANDLYQDIERGQGLYLIAYQDGKPSELFFAGYSYD